MLLPDWIQLLRNGFCVARALAPKGSALLNVPFPTSNLPLSVIDYGIVSTQLPAVYYFGNGGLSSLKNSMGNGKKYKKLLSELDQYHFEDIKTEDGVGPETVVAILRHGIRNELEQTDRQFKVGVSQVMIATGFAFFALNTLQFRFKSHPGPVVNAVISLLIGLSYLLYTMALSIFTRSKNVISARRLRRALKKSPIGNSPGEMISLAYKSGYGDDMMEALTALTASEESGSSTLNFDYKSNSFDLKEIIENDLTKIRSTLLSLKDATATTFTDNDEASHQTRSHAKNTAAQHVSPTVLASLDARKRSEIVSGVNTFVFFALNFLAGYSYLLCVLAFYLPHEKFAGDSIIGSVVSLLMLNNPSGTADWWGGFMGDLFWTIEPLLVLVNPYVTKFAFKALGKQTKEKQE